MVIRRYIYILTILTMLTVLIFTDTSAATTTTPPADIKNLHVDSYRQDYILWNWEDPNVSDLDHIEVYINGVFKADVPRGVRQYNATGLIPYARYTISTRTVDTSGNLGEHKNYTIRTKRDYTSPNSISNLRADSFGIDNIKWVWKDPPDIDLDHIEIYIDGVFKKNIPKGVESYSAIGLNRNTKYDIGTHTVDTSRNINKEWKNNTAKTTNKKSSKGIRFVTIGDPHISNGSDRLKMAVNYINGMNNINFVVIMGDISEFSIAKNILDRLDVPYYVVAGNHDLKSGSLKSFESYFGSAKRIININGYQLIFVGIKGTSDQYEWDFDYSTADKNKPTIIFNHGPVQPKPGGSCSDWGNYFGYACDMKSEVNKFTRLLAYYAGHTHIGTEQKIGGVLYTTEDNLGGYGPASDYIGYTDIKGDTVSYNLIRYTN